MIFWKLQLDLDVIIVFWIFEWLRMIYNYKELKLTLQAESFSVWQHHQQKLRQRRVTTISANAYGGGVFVMPSLCPLRKRQERPSCLNARRRRLTKTKLAFALWWGQLAEEEKVLAYNATIFVKSFPGKGKILPLYTTEICSWTDMIDEYGYGNEDICRKPGSI